MWTYEEMIEVSLFTLQTGTETQYANSHPQNPKDTKCVFQMQMPNRESQQMTHFAYSCQTECRDMHRTNIQSKCDTEATGNHSIDC